MKIGEVIRDFLKKRDRTQRWLATKLNIDEKTFSGKLKRGSIDAEELLTIAHFLDIDLNKLAKDQIPMFAWLVNWRYQFKGEHDTVGIEVIEVDSEGNMKIAVTEAEKDIPVTESKTLQVLISRIKYSFTDFDNWESTLFDRLRSTNSLRLYAFRTVLSERDIETLEVCRVETSIKTGNEASLNLISYIMLQDGKLFGNPLTFDKQTENQQFFANWLMNIAINIHPFNSDHYLCFEESQIPIAEIETLRVVQQNKK